MLLLCAAGCAQGASTSQSASTGTSQGTGTATPTPNGSEAMRAADVVATVSTGSDGRFTLRLAPGVYRLVATAAGPLRATAAAQITVVSSPVNTNLIVDSGMR